MILNPHNQYVVVSKRPHRIADFLKEVLPAGSRLPSHIAVLITVENQDCMDERGPVLLRLPAYTKGFIVEPMLEQIDLSVIEPPTKAGEAEQVQWVVAGEENGHGARPCKADWLRDLNFQCQVRGIPFFNKGTLSPKVRQYPKGWAE